VNVTDDRLYVNLSNVGRNNNGNFANIKTEYQIGKMKSITWKKEEKQEY
jgi:hypothetical protein